MNYEGVIVGLGNPGRRYERTRHNFGFLVADGLLSPAVQRSGISSEAVKTVQDLYELYRVRFAAGQKVWLVVKPATFMNRSGLAVSRVCSYFRIPPDRLLVLHDELDLPLGRIKLKFGGGTAGHNGLRSIADSLGALDFYRLRLGIGKPTQAAMAVTDYVLGRFPEHEQELVARVVDVALDGIERFVDQGASPATEFVNSFQLSVASGLEQ